MKLSDNLNMLMAKARLNSNDLAKLTGLPGSTIKRIRNSEQCNPTISTLLPIAEHFSISISELLGLEPSKTDIHIDRKPNAIPLFTWRDCSNFKNIDYSKYPNKIFTAWKGSEKCYSLKVTDSGLDFFPESSLLIVDPNLMPESGDYVIVSKSENGLASIKKYIVETDQVYLKSLVPGLGVISLTSEHNILGVIAQYKIQMKQARELA